MKVPSLKPILLLLLLCAAALPTRADKPNVAIYIEGQPKNQAILRLAFNDALVNSGRYNVVAVDAIRTVEREQARQLEESVRRSEAVKIGEDAGAAYVFLIERADDSPKAYYISARLINVERKIAELAKLSERILDGSDVAEVIKSQVATMLNLPPPPRTITIPARPAGSAARSGAPAQTYRTVTIGGWTWMADNMNVETGKSWCYGNKEENCQKYGRLYDWETANKVCPAGWRLPIRKEWDYLAEDAGGEKTAGKKLKAKTAWNGTDELGWGATPGGSRHHGDGTFNSAGETGAWWSASESRSGNAYGRYITGGRDFMYENDSKKETGYSVRCVME